MGVEDPVARLPPPLAQWFRARFPAPTPAQALALPVLAERRHLLLASPTGSGKTLAAFLHVIGDLHEKAAAGALEDGIHCLYVSPLKALVNDVARNLQAPLAAVPGELRVAIRTGDTPAAERERIVRNPPHILVTTPESAALVLASKRMRAHMGPLAWVVVDEVHALAGNKRGAHLALTLERIERYARASPTRVGLSATVAPLDEVARWLCGGRPCEVREAPPKPPPTIDIRLAPTDDGLLDILAERVAANPSAIVFAPTRAEVERLTRRLRASLGEPTVEEGEEDEEPSIDPEFAPAERSTSVAPHHGSMSKQDRLVIEERLKRQDLRCVVTSSSLELGVHLDGVDEVILVGSPKSAARTLQRVGRSAHHVAAVSRATLVVRDADDLAEAMAIARLARERQVEPVALPEAPLDVLAQHLAGLALEESDVEDAWELVRRAAPYARLSRQDFDDILAMLQHDLVDREFGAIVPSGPRTLRAVTTQNGAIPEAGLVKCYHGRRYVGELDEAFVASLSPGDTLQLAGETWRFVSALARSARLEPARGQHPTVPDWRAEGLSMSPLVAHATRPLREADTEQTIRSQCAHASGVTEDQWRVHLRRQAAFSGMPRGVAAEVCVADDGARALILHHVAGRRTNEALARALAVRVGSARPLAADTGFAILGPRAWKPTAAAVRALFGTPLEADVRAHVASGELLKRRFRHVAFRALRLRYDLIPEAERQRAANGLLLALLREQPDHPLLREAWRECLHEALDLEGAESARAAIASGEMPLVMLPLRPHPSPMGARILVRNADLSRERRLRDHDERVDEWLAHRATQPAP